MVLSLTVTFSAWMRQKTCRFLTRNVRRLKKKQLQWRLIHVRTLMIPWSCSVHGRRSVSTQLGGWRAAARWANPLPSRCEHLQPISGESSLSVTIWRIMEDFKGFSALKTGAACTTQSSDINYPFTVAEYSCGGFMDSCLFVLGTMRTK